MVLLPACSLQKQEQFQLAQARFCDEEKRRTHRTCCTGNECKSNKVGYQNLDTGHSDIESMMQEVRVHENIAAAVKELRPVPKQCYKKTAAPCQNRCPQMKRMNSVAIMQKNSFAIPTMPVVL
jgi:hypothetical protein